MRRIALHDDPPTRQEQQIADLGGDLYNRDVFDESDTGALEEPAFGADPFDIVAHREEQLIEFTISLSIALRRNRK